MKILFIHSYYQIRGGEDAVFEDDMLLLKEKGYQVDSIIFNNTRQSLAKFIQLPFNILSYKKVVNKLKIFQPDLVHIHNMHFGASPSVIKAVKQAKVPCIVTLHNFRLICPSGTLFSKGSLFLNSIQKTFPWKAVKQAVFKNSRLLAFWLAFSIWINHKIKTWEKIDKFIVLNHFARDLYQLHFSGLPAGRFKVKPNFSYDPSFITGNRTNTFLYVGRLSDEKGIQVLLDAHHASKFELVIIGDGPLRCIVEQHVTCHKNLTYLGGQGKAIVIEYMRKCAALLLPSVCMEMNPLTMVKSMACGMPVISSNLDTLKQFIVDQYNGLTFRVNDPAGMNECIHQYLSLAPEQKLALSRNARTTYETYFTKEASFKELITIYNSLL